MIIDPQWNIHIEEKVVQLFYIAYATLFMKCLNHHGNVVDKKKKDKDQFYWSFTSCFRVNLNSSWLSSMDAEILYLLHLPSVGARKIIMKNLSCLLPFLDICLWNPLTTFPYLPIIYRRPSSAPYSHPILHRTLFPSHIYYCCFPPNLHVFQDGEKNR